jgi:DNA-binding GntR family transcriptional regulator
VTPAERRTSGVAIAEELLRLIHRQVYQPGDRVTEQEIADRFNVSRGPVRESLRILAARGVLKIVPMRGATVIRLNDTEALDAIEMSAVLFGLAARRAAERATTAEKKHIAKGAAELEALAQKDISGREFFLATVEVGRAVVAAAQSDRLFAELTQIRAGAPNLFGPLGFATTAIRRKAAKNWILLAEAIASGDSRKAERVGVLLHDDACRAAQKLAF